MTRYAFTLAIFVTISCAASSSASAPVVQATSTETAALVSTTSAPPRSRPADMPLLCDLDGGRWCEPCATCPQEDTGALCCSGGICVVWDGSSCSGILGWCQNYTTEKDEATGINVATCHDGNS